MYVDISPVNLNKTKDSNSALICQPADEQEKEKKKKKTKKEKVVDEKPAEDGADGEASPPPREEPKRAQRGTSNVFALFNQAQIQEFKEVCLSWLMTNVLLCLLILTNVVCVDLDGCILGMTAATECINA